MYVGTHALLIPRIEEYTRWTQACNSRRDRQKSTVGEYNVIPSFLPQFTYSDVNLLGSFSCQIFIRLFIGSESN